MFPTVKLSFANTREEIIPQPIRKIVVGTIIWKIQQQSHYYRVFSVISFDKQSENNCTNLLLQLFKHVFSSDRRPLQLNNESGSEIPLVLWFLQANHSVTNTFVKLHNQDDKASELLHYNDRYIRYNMKYSNLDSICQYSLV